MGVKTLEYRKKLQERLRSRITQQYGEQIGAVIVLYGIASILVLSYLLANNDIGVAWEKFFDYFVPTIIGGIVIFIGLMLIWLFFSIPSELYNEQAQIINSRAPKRLDIFVGTSPMKGWLVDGNNDIRTAYLTVINRENKKLVEFHAKRLELLQRTAAMKPNLRGAMFGSGVSNFRFEWDNGDVFTEIIPGDKDELLIAELNVEIGYPVFGESKTPAPNDGDVPSIYEVRIRFKGKREGETYFSYYDYLTEIYCHTENEILDFAEMSPDIPLELKEKVLFEKKDT